MSGANSAINLSDQVGYQFSFPAPGVDFRDGVITWRVMALENNDNFFVNFYAQNGAPDYSNVYPLNRALSAANFPPNAWVEVTLDLSAYGFIAGVDAGVVDAGGDAGDGGAPVAPGTFDKTTVESIGIQVGTSTAFAGTGVVRLAIDSVTIEGVPGQANRLFTTTAEGLAINVYEVPPGTQAPIAHP